MLNKLNLPLLPSSPLPLPKTAYKNTNTANVGKAVVFLSDLLQFMAKKIALLVQNCADEKSCQNPFSAILRLITKQKSSDGH